MCRSCLSDCSLKFGYKHLTVEVGLTFLILAYTSELVKTEWASNSLMIVMLASGDACLSSVSSKQRVASFMYLSYTRISFS
ncbi:hypothetical protein D3C84_1044980 [compost metagenome]